MIQKILFIKQKQVNRFRFRKRAMVTKRERDRLGGWD